MIKKQLFWWVILTILVIVGLTFLGDEHGHVMIVRHPYRIQLSFNLLLVLLALGFILFYYLMRIFGSVKSMPAKFKSKSNIKQLNQQQNLIIQGVQALIEDKPDQAKKLLAKANKQADNQAITDVVTQLEEKAQALKQLPNK